ncbi:MAG TPA: hypothetical protein VGO52_25090 [Hyphomonadaceae bacterium]|jgi:hypothetical protein|nr:hypothetical protein [Hyphomonadaceae bacterium]
MIRPALLAALAVLSAAPALAQVSPQDSKAAPRSSERAAAAASIEGDWGFRADPTAGDKCVLSGDIRIRKAKAGAFTCTFTARLACERSVDRTVDTEQSCTASLKGSAVTIRSKLERVTKVDDKPLKGGFGYFPDSFDLVLNAYGDEMLGKSYDVNSAEKVKFQRKQELIS